MSNITRGDLEDANWGGPPHLAAWREDIEAYARKRVEEANAETNLMEAASTYWQGEVSRLQAENERLREAIKEALGYPGGHASHWDSKGTHGANCPQCEIDRERAKILRKALDGDAS